jgi:1-acyl-sn-glycerol-3-phosphate acyltransferase
MEGTRVPRTIVTVGAFVADWFIRYSVRAHFQAVYCKEEVTPDPKRAAVVFANHHYWWDGFLCYLMGRRWRQPMSLWMEEWRWFPPFWALGALPYPPHHTMARARTVRQTVRLLQRPPRVLFLFPEGVIHAGDDLLPFGRSLYWLAQQVPDVQLLPMSIVISHTLHQYPRAFLHVGAPFVAHSRSPDEWLTEARNHVALRTQRLRHEAECCYTLEKAQEAGFQILVKGKPSVHERWWARLMP